MFSVRQKRDIADAVQRILRETGHPELPEGEIAFTLHVDGAQPWSWADIRNNGGVEKPGVNPWNEAQDHIKREQDEAAASGDFETIPEEPPGAEDAGVIPPHNARRNA